MGGEDRFDERALVRVRMDVCDVRNVRGWHRAGFLQVEVKYADRMSKPMTWLRPLSMRRAKGVFDEAGGSGEDDIHAF